MRNYKFTHLLLVISMSLGPIAAIGGDTPEKLNGSLIASARPAAVPIGSVNSLEAIEINGTPTGQQSLVWNGDIIRSAPGASVQMTVTELGSLTLRGGSAVKVVANIATQVLSAIVLQGELQVALKPSASAQLELAGQSFLAARGAQFRVAIRDEQPRISSLAGQIVSLGNYGIQLNGELTAAVQAQQTAPRKYIIKPLNLGTNTEIRARSTRNLQVQVTDENDRPVPDAPILFLLGGGSGSGNAGTLAGQTSLRAVTNSQGVAQVNFTAGDAVGSRTQIEVRVENTNAVWQGTITVTRAVAGFWSPQNAVPIFGVIGAAAGIGIYKAVNRNTVPQSPNIEPRTGGSVILP